jgi:DNA primase
VNAGKAAKEERAGVPLTNPDQPLFDGAGATKRDLVDYLDGVRDRLIPVLEEALREPRGT